MNAWLFWVCRPRLGRFVKNWWFGEKGKLRKHFQELGKYQDKSKISSLTILSRYPVKCFHYYLKVSLRNAYEKGKISNIYDIFQLDSRSVSKTKEPDSSAYRKNCISSSLSDPFCCIGIGFFCISLSNSKTKAKLKKRK